MSKPGMPGAPGSDDELGMPGMDSMPGRQSAPEWLTAAEVTQRLGVSRRTLNRAVDDGRLTPQTIRGAHGPELRFDPDEVAAYAGRRDAIDPNDDPGTLANPGMPSTPSMPPTPGSDVMATTSQEAGAALFAQAVQAAVTAATVPLAAELARREETIADKDATIKRQAEELGMARERARQAEERAAGLELAARRQQRPWWWRLLGH